MNTRSDLQTSSPTDMGFGQQLRSVVFTTALFLTTLVYGIVIVSCFWLPFRPRFQLAVAWATTILWMLKKICRLDYVVEGRENIPPDCHISMWKHSSSWETMAQAVIFPPQSWVLKRELLWIPFVGWAIKLMRPIAIDRGGGQRAINQVVEQGKQRLIEGMWILIFPEGTRMAPGATRKYGISGALLAIRSGRKVVPVAHNAGDFWQRRGLLKKPGTIRVVIGQPIDPAGLDPRELNEKVQSWIETTLSGMRK